MHVLHHQEVQALLLAQLFHAHHVRVLDARAEQRLVHEEADEHFVAGEVRMDDLDGDVLREPSRPNSTAEIQRTHAARFELCEDLVVAKPVAYAQHSEDGSYAARTPTCEVCSCVTIA